MIPEKRPESRVTRGQTLGQGRKTTPSGLGGADPLVRAGRPPPAAGTTTSTSCGAPAGRRGRRPRTMGSAPPFPQDWRCARFFMGFRGPKAHSNRPGGEAGRTVLLLAYLQLHGAGDGVHVGIVILVDARLEGAGADGVLGAQTEMQGDGVAGGDGIEVENRLRRGERELLQAASLTARGLLLEGLQVFGEQVEAGRNPQIDQIGR